MSPRLSHNKFYKSKPVFGDSKFDKVVTTMWTYESDVCILTYAATVFKKDSETDFWKRKNHKEETLKRFKENPIRIKLFSEKCPELMNNAMDWYIAKDLIFKYGTHNKTYPDVRRVHHEVQLRPDFNEYYYTLYSDIYQEDSEHCSSCPFSPSSYYIFGFVVGTGATIFAQYVTSVYF